MKPPRVSIYGRVSTDRQNHDSQLGELRDYAARRGWGTPDEYLDTASGAKVDRAELARLMAVVRRGRVDVILCYKLDRLGRSLSHLAQIIEELRLHCVALVVPSQGIDTTAGNPRGGFPVEHPGCRGRVREGHHHRAGCAPAWPPRRAKGTRLGRPETLTRHAGAVAALMAQGKGPRAIGRELGLPPSSVAKIAKHLPTGIAHNRPEPRSCEGGPPRAPQALNPVQAV